MWYEDLQEGRAWNSLWFGYVRCSCGGIQSTEAACPACGAPAPRCESMVVVAADGTEVEVLSALMGAEGRYEDWVYLQMLEREWMRPITDADRFLSVSERSRPSARAVIVLIFWTYFETRIERLLRENMRSIPERITEELLQRYSGIGSRLDRLYKLLFSTTYWSDLNALGFQQIANLLQRVQERRNQFSHGHPEAIDDTLIRDLIASLKEEHQAWIAVFNHRVKEGVLCS